MSEGTRKGIELAICGILRERMAAEGYGYTKDSGDNYFTKSGGESGWTISFHLWGTGPYYFMDQAWVSYTGLSQVVQALLAGTEFESEALRLGVAASTHVSNYWPASVPRSVVGMEGVDAFCATFLAAVKEAEQDFLVPYSAPAKAAHECTLFYTKWPRGMQPIATGYCLIGYGIDKGDLDKLQLGIERIDKKIDTASNDLLRRMALAVKAAALAKVESWTKD